MYIKLQSLHQPREHRNLAKQRYIADVYNRYVYGYIAIEEYVELLVNVVLPANL